MKSSTSLSAARLSILNAYSRPASVICYSSNEKTPQPTFRQAGVEERRPPALDAGDRGREIDGPASELDGVELISFTTGQVDFVDILEDDLLVSVRTVRRVRYREGVVQAILTS